MMVSPLDLLPLRTSCAPTQTSQGILWGWVRSLRTQADCVWPPRDLCCMSRFQGAAVDIVARVEAVAEDETLQSTTLPARSGLCDFFVLAIFTPLPLPLFRWPRCPRTPTSPQAQCQVIHSSK